MDVETNEAAALDMEATLFYAIGIGAMLLLRLAGGVKAYSPTR